MHEFDDRPSRMQRLRVPVLALAAVAAIVGWLVFNPPSFFATPAEEVREQRETGEVRVSSLTESFSAEGTLSATREWTINHPVTGTLTEIAAESDLVVTGSILYRVDNVPTVAIV